MSYPLQRPRRLRQNQKIRCFVQNIQIPYEQLILPLFIRYGKGEPRPIISMPGHFQIPLEHLAKTMKYLKKINLKGVILFGIPEQKDERGSSSLDKNGIIQQAIPIIKQATPEMLVIADTCLCEYTHHGHCGILEQKQDHPDGFEINNDESIKILGEQAVSLAKAGADIIAPSACLDGMIGAIRHALDNNNLKHTIILSYAVKYASHLYGPFRQAAEGAPQIGDRKSYQMDYQNSKDALHECQLDIQEGADMLLVKPGHTYLDIIYQVKQTFPEYPLGAYHTSGEFAMLKAAAEKAWIDEKKVVHEVMCAFRRAGCDFIITYYAKELLEWRLENNLN
jgi:porphobilinogen synthase